MEKSALRNLWMAPKLPVFPVRTSGDINCVLHLVKTRDEMLLRRFSAAPTRRRQRWMWTSGVRVATLFAMSTLSRRRRRFVCRRRLRELLLSHHTTIREPTLRTAFITRFSTLPIANSKLIQAN